MIKKYALFLVALLTSFSGGIIFATEEEKTNAPLDVPAGEKADAKHCTKKVSRKDIRMLKTLFLMSDKELARMRELITKLERTPEAKRREMAENLERANSDDPNVRREFMETMRRRFEARRKNLLARYYATLPQEQAKSEAEAFLKMSRHEQFEYIKSVREKLGLPPHPRKEKKAEVNKAAETQ